MLFFFRKSNLIAGPFAGEFGWELMEWQGWVRRLKKKYERTLVISYPHSQYLYEGCEFYAHALDLGKSGFGYGSLPVDAALAIVERCAKNLGIVSYDWFAPHMLRQPLKLLLRGQDFTTFHEPPAGTLKPDIVFHFRDFAREDGDFKNYPKQDADKLIRLCRETGYRVGCLGGPALSYCPDGCMDLRSRDLKTAVSAICSATLVAGGSSAPMHLASLCNTPIVVWTGPPFDAKRYFAHWNPHKSKVFLVTEKSFRPPAEEVLAAIQNAMMTLKGRP
jgi:hypothetical protein